MTIEGEVEGKARPRRRETEWIEKQNKTKLGSGRMKNDLGKGKDTQENSGGSDCVDYDNTAAAFLFSKPLLGSVNLSFLIHQIPYIP